MQCQAHSRHTARVEALPRLTPLLTPAAGDRCVPGPPPPPPGTLPAPADPSSACSGLAAANLRPHCPPSPPQFWMLILATTMPIPAGYFMPIFIYGEC